MALIEICETEDVGFNFFDSFPVNFKFKVLVNPEKTDYAIS